MNKPIKDATWIKKKVCGEKRQYPTKELAELAVIIRQQGHTVYKDLKAYECRYCKYFHVGHG